MRVTVGNSGIWCVCVIFWVLNSSFVCWFKKQQFNRNISIFSHRLKKQQFKIRLAPLSFCQLSSRFWYQPLLYSLSIGLFQQSWPEFISCFRVGEDEATMAGGQIVINDYIHPPTTPPELEVKDASILHACWPFLGPVVRYHLKMRAGGKVGEWKGQWSV